MKGFIITPVCYLRRKIGNYKEVAALHWVLQASWVLNKICPWWFSSPGVFASFQSSNSYRGLHSTAAVFC